MLKHLVTLHPTLLSVPMQMQGFGVPVNDMLPHSGTLAWTAFQGWSQLLPVQQCLMLSG